MLSCMDGLGWRGEGESAGSWIKVHVEIRRCDGGRGILGLGCVDRGLYVDMVGELGIARA